MKQRSSGDNPNKYLNPGFYSNPENQFWNKPTHVVTDRNGAVDVVLGTSEKGKLYYNECQKNREKKEKMYRSHNL